MTNTIISRVRDSLLTVTLLAAWSCYLLPSPPFPEPDRLVVIRETDAGGAALGVAPGNYLAWRGFRGFESVSAHDVTDMGLQGDEPRKVRTVRCTFDLFETLGVAPVLGRTFVAGDRERGVAILSYDLWQDRLAGKSDIIGGDITLDGEAHTVIGILPGGTRYPDAGDVWILLPRPAEGAHALTVTARLSPGVTPEQAAASLKELDLPCGHEARVTSFRDALAGDSGEPARQPASATRP